MHHEYAKYTSSCNPNPKPVKFIDFVNFLNFWFQFFVPHHLHPLLQIGQMDVRNANQIIFCQRIKVIQCHSKVPAEVSNNRRGKGQNTKIIIRISLQQHQDTYLPERFVW